MIFDAPLNKMIMHSDRASLEYLQQPILPIIGRLRNQCNFQHARF